MANREDLIRAQMQMLEQKTPVKFNAGVLDTPMERAERVAAVDTSRPGVANASLPINDPNRYAVGDPRRTKLMTEQVQNARVDASRGTMTDASRGMYDTSGSQMRTVGNMSQNLVNEQIKRKRELELANAPVDFMPGQGSGKLTFNQGRVREFVKQKPSPIQPGIPVSARGAAESFSGNGPQLDYLPGTGRGIPTEAGFLPQYRSGTPNASSLGAGGGSGFPSLSAEEFLSLSPQQQAQYQQAALANKAARDQQMIQQTYQPLENRFGQRELDVQDQINQLSAGGLSPAQQAQEDQFKAELQDDKAALIQQAEKDAEEQKQQVRDALSFAGMGDSGFIADRIDKINQRVSEYKERIEKESGRQLNQFHVGMLAKNEAKIEKLEGRLESTRSQQDQILLMKGKDQRESLMAILSQDPTNPENMMRAAKELKAQKLEEFKMAVEEQKELRKEARDNFQWMTGNLGSSFVYDMSDEEIKTLSANIGIPASVLSNMAPTLKEIENEWDRAKYEQDFTYRALNDQANRDQAKTLRDMDYRNAMEKIGVQFEYDMQKMYLGEQFKGALAAQKYRQFGAEDYSAVADGSNGSALYFSGADVSHPTAKVPVAAYNPLLANCYPNGSKKSPQDGPNGLGGQCAYEAEQWTDLGAVGNLRSQKESTLIAAQKKGKAMLRGEYVPQDVKVGYTILTNESKEYGHVAVVNAITADGKAVLSEFNRGGALTFTNNRVVDLNDPMIFGIWKTNLKSEYQLPQGAPEKTISNGDSYMGREAIISGGLPEAQINKIGTQLFEAANDPYNPYQDVARQKYETFLSDASKSRQVSQKELTVSQGGAVSAAVLAGNAERDIQGLQKTAKLNELNTWIARQTNDDTLVSDALRGTITPEQQQYLTAMQLWTEAVLRRKSGAAISVGEYKAYHRMYFPQVNDSPSLAAQKERNRKAAMLGLYAEAGTQGKQQIDDALTQLSTPSSSQQYTIPEDVSSSYQPAVNADWF